MCIGLGTEFRSEKIPRNRLGTVSVIPRKKVLIPRHSEFRGRANSEARNGMERNGIPRKKICRHGWSVIYKLLVAFAKIKKFFFHSPGFPWVPDSSQGKPGVGKKLKSKK